MSKINLNKLYDGLFYLRNFWPIAKSNFQSIETGHNDLEDRVSNIVASAGNSNTEIVDARQSTVKNKTFPTLDGRLEENEQDVKSHLSDLTAHATKNEIVLYVRTDGNDSNDGSANTSAKALRTIQAAINKLPQLINHNVSIKVEAGTYTEDVVINGFVGKGQFYLTGGNSLATSTNYKINSLLIKNCDIIINITGFEATTTSGISFTSTTNKFTYINNCRAVSVAPSQVGAFASSGSTAYFLNSEISNKNTAISAYGSTVLSLNNIGNGNTVALYSTEGATIGKYGGQPSGTTAEVANNGGVIR